MRAGRRRRAGFTLIEVVVAMGVVTILLAGWTAMYTAGLKQVVENQAGAAVNREAENAIDYVDKDIKQAIVTKSTVAITSPATAAGTWTPNASTLVLQLPAWDAANTQTIIGHYDYVIYQFIVQQNISGVYHNIYNIRRIVSPDPSSSRVAEDRWLFPYDANRDAANITLKRSDPWANYVSGSGNVMFTYYIQDAAHPGQVLAKGASDTFDSVVLVETRYTTFKDYNATTLSADIDTRSRLRNWAPPGS